MPDARWEGLQKAICTRRSAARNNDFMLEEWRPPSSLRFHKARRTEADHNGFSYNNNNREKKNGFNGYAGISEELRETRRKRVQVGGGADGGRGNE